MPSKFCCTKCGEDYLEMEWDQFVNAEGKIGARAYLICLKCYEKESDCVLVDDEFDWKGWNEYKYFDNKIKYDLLGELIEKLLNNMDF